MAQLIPYLGFGGNCREAMEFYKSVLGGELKIQTMGDSPMASSTPAELHTNVMHSSLTNEHITLYASDMMGPGDAFVHGVSLCLVCDSKEQTERLYTGLAAGGNAEHPLKEEFFGTYGDLVDTYGNRWMLQFDPNAQK
jgi:PhnB protein